MAMLSAERQHDLYHEMLKKRGTHLEVGYRRIAEVNPRIEVLAGLLVDLNLTGNALSALPAAVAKLTKLRSLNIAHNAFDALPACLDVLPLRELRCAGNRLSYFGADAPLAGVKAAALPPPLVENLEFLDATGNQLERVSLVPFAARASGRRRRAPRRCGARGRVRC